MHNTHQGRARFVLLEFPIIFLWVLVCGFLPIEATCVCVCVRNMLLRFSVGGFPPRNTILSSATAFVSHGTLWKKGNQLVSLADAGAGRLGGDRSVRLDQNWAVASIGGSTRSGVASEGVGALAGRSIIAFWH